MTIDYKRLKMFTERIKEENSENDIDFFLTAHPDKIIFSYKIFYFGNEDRGQKEITPESDFDIVSFLIGQVLFYKDLPF